VVKEFAIQEVTKNPEELVFGVFCCLNEPRLCLSAALRPENEEVLIRKKA
jgi:hypothetical protein